MYSKSMKIMYEYSYFFENYWVANQSLHLLFIGTYCIEFDVGSMLTSLLAHERTMYSVYRAKTQWWNTSSDCFLYVILLQNNTTVSVLSAMKSLNTISMNVSMLGKVTLAQKLTFRCWQFPYIFFFWRF